MRLINAIIAIVILTAVGGCMPINSWRLNDFSDRLAYPAADAVSAQANELRVIAFLPSIGLKKVEPPITASTTQPVTEAVFIRSDNDHFHITVTVRCLCRLDAPGWATIVQVDSYNIGEEGSREAGQSILNEIAQLYGRGG